MAIGLDMGKRKKLEKATLWIAAAAFLPFTGNFIMPILQKSVFGTAATWGMIFGGAALYLAWMSMKGRL